ncbi:hypothetical protein [Kitasatospora sp. NPDC089509]|uniref:hypothetical protein n=1 Tax=Kitasatospora sp. NPDC089509 TaxID=3364079 RepID=UPI0038084147
MRLRHALAATTAAAALALTTAGVATAAPESTQSCGWFDIGSPGNITIGGNYAGQVEQQYDGCGNSRGHFQWAGPFQANYATVTVFMWASNGTQAGFYTGDTNSKDVYSYNVGIHSTSPDAWEASATVSGCNATGTMHNYADGGTWWDPNNAYC